MANVPVFYRAAKEYGVKPIIGQEFYFVEDVNEKSREAIHHLTVFAKNLEGYRNLIKLSSIAYEHMYYKPRIDFNLLKQYKDGLIVTSGCLAGHVCQFLLKDDYESARRFIQQFLDIVGDDFYIEIQNHYLPEQQKVLGGLKSLAQEFGIPMLAASDAHYLSKEDAEIQRVLLAVQSNQTLEQFMESGGFEGFTTSEEFYIRDYDETIKAFKGFEEAVKNTLVLTEKCNLVVPEFEKLEYRFPKIDLEGYDNPTQMLRALCEKGLFRRVKDWANFHKYVQRMEYEISVIDQLGFSSYFLIVQDFVNWARRNGIRTGVGRGSAGGSLVAYLLGITHIDPIQHDLMFERFLDPNRASNPDIDVDIMDTKRDLVIRYLADKYGHDHVCHIGTFGTLGVKSAIKDVAKALGYDFQTINQITTSIPNTATFDEALELPEVKELLADDPRFQRVIEIARHLEDLKRQYGIHAAGMLVSPEPINNLVPTRTEKGQVVTQWDMTDIEAVGLLKLDLLGLRTLTVIDDCVKLVQERHGIDIDVDNLPLDDEKTYEILRRGEVLGIFQMEGKAVRELLVQLEPTEFFDLVAAVSLGRPGPLDAKDEQGRTMAEHYIDRKFGREPVEYDHPCLEPVLKGTYGIAVFQEDLQRMVVELADFTLAEGYKLLKAAAKKKPEELQKFKDKFIEGFVRKWRCSNENRHSGQS